MFLSAIQIISVVCSSFLRSPFSGHVGLEGIRKSHHHNFFIGREEFLFLLNPFRGGDHIDQIKTVVGGQHELVAIHMTEHRTNVKHRNHHAHMDPSQRKRILDLRLILFQNIARKLSFRKRLRFASEWTKLLNRQPHPSKRFIDLRAAANTHHNETSAA